MEQWVVLANPAAIEQYNGLKHVDDTDDAFFLAELLRLGILPTGFFYDPKTLPSRDLLNFSGPAQSGLGARTPDRSPSYRPGHQGAC